MNQSEANAGGIAVRPAESTIDLRPFDRPAEPSHGRFRGDVEGLRALAVVSVVLYHAGAPFFTGGFVGVDVFFVLSGFLITGLLVSEIRRTGRVSISNFYARRVRRILPAATTVLLASVAMTYLLIPALDRASIGWDIVTAGLFSSNWRFAAQATEYSMIDQMPSPVLNYWSLGVEEQFYVVWPLLLVVVALFATRFGWPRTKVLVGAVGAVAAVSLYWSVGLTHDNQPMAFFSTPARAWELAAGALVALVGSRAARLPRVMRAIVGWAGLAMIVVAVIAYNDDVLFPGTAALLPVLGTVAVLLAGAGVAGAAIWEPYQWLASGPTRFVGRVSYSWYLWHWPLLIFGAAALGVARLELRPALVVVVLSFGLSVVTLKLIENPLRHPTSVISGLRRTRPALVFGMVLTLISVGAGMSMVSQSEAEASRSVSVGGIELVMSPAKAAKDLGPATGRCYGPESVDNDCYFAKTDSATTVALIGDSHAQEWFGATEGAAKAAGWRLSFASMPGCPIADVTLADRFNANARWADCVTYQQTVVHRMLADRPALVVFAARNGSQRAYDADGTLLEPGPSKKLIAEGTASNVRQLRAAGLKVVVLRDTPLFPSDVPACVTKNLNTVRNCDVRFNDKSLPETDSLKTAVEAAGAVWIDGLSWVCPEPGSCTAVDKGMVKFRDTDHMTYTFSKTLSGRLGAELNRAISAR
ncbi:MAG: acyltransferase family protein [Actinomycetes bacterium]